MDFFKDDCLKHGMAVELPSIYMEERSSSTFILIRKACASRRVINAVINCVDELVEHTILEAESKLDETF